MTDDGNHGGATAQEATAACFACETPLLSLPLSPPPPCSLLCRSVDKTGCPFNRYSNEPLLLSRPPPPAPPATDEATLPPGHHAHSMVNQIGGHQSPHSNRHLLMFSQILPPPYACCLACPLPLLLWDISCRILYRKTWRAAARRLPCAAAAAAAATPCTAPASRPAKSTLTYVDTPTCHPLSLLILLIAS